MPETLEFPAFLRLSSMRLAGLFGGIFVGCWAMALTEMLDLFPIFIRRIRLVRGIGAIIIGIAFGKGLGALLFFWKRW